MLSKDDLNGQMLQGCVDTPCNIAEVYVCYLHTTCRMYVYADVLHSILTLHALVSTVTEIDCQRSLS